MTNKNVLVAVTPDSSDACMFQFLSEYLDGENLHITVCKLSPDQLSSQTETYLADFLSTCQSRSIPYKIRNLAKDALNKLKLEMTFSDIMVIHKESLKPISFADNFEWNVCPIIVLPSGFHHVSNIVLAMDSSRNSLFAIKQFLQIFSNNMRRLQMTLLDIATPNSNEWTVDEESRLISYLKLYNSNLAVLKVRYPISAESLQPIAIDSETMVVGSTKFLMDQYGESTVFKPFYDYQSAVFLPTQNA